MPYSREKKKEIIDKLTRHLKEQKALVFVDYKGLKTSDLVDLKSRLKKINGLFVVAKKTLLRIAAEETSKDLSEKIKELEGQLAVVFAFGDEIAVSKEVFNFSRNNENLRILGGFFDQKFRGKDETIAIAKLPSRQELISRLINGLKAPIYNFEQVLSFNLRALINILNQVGKG